MSIEKINRARAEITSASAYKLLEEFFDEGSFCEIGAFAKSGDGFAEAVAGSGTVEGLPVCAFAQNSDACGGALSKAQTEKLKKLYDLAIKTGAPVVGFYDSAGGRLAQGSELLAGCGRVLNSAALLSGVVPQISVVIGACLGTNALNAVSADFVIMSKKAQLSLSVTGEGSDAEYNAKHGITAVTAEDTADAVAAAKRLVTYLPSNNLSAAPRTDGGEPSPDAGCVVAKTADFESVFKLYGSYGEGAYTALARIDGRVVGIARAEGDILGCSAASKLSRLVSFCDAFSIPVVTFVDCAGFGSLKSAAKLASVYAQATTAKISVINGKAIGSAYIALAGTGANADTVYALPNAVVSPVNVEAAAFIMAPDEMKVSVGEQKAAAEKFAEENLSAFNAAQNGYIDGIVDESELRPTLIRALDMLSNKRVSTVAKKHSTV